MGQGCEKATWGDVRARKSFRRNSAFSGFAFKVSVCVVDMTN